MQSLIVSSGARRWVANERMQHGGPRAGEAVKALECQLSADLLLIEHMCFSRLPTAAKGAPSGKQTSRAHAALHGPDQGARKSCAPALAVDVQRLAKGPRVSALAWPSEALVPRGPRGVGLAL